MKIFAIVLLATAVLAAPKETPKKQDKRSLSHTGDLGISAYGYPSYGLSSYGLPSYNLPSYGLGLSGYSTGLGTKVLGSGLTVGNSLTSAYASGLGYGLGTLGGAGVVVGRSDLSSGLGLGVLPSLAPAKTERITGVTLHREVQVPVPVPQPVPVEVTKHVPVPQPVPVKVDRPYPVAVPHPVPVEVTRHVPVKVDRPYPVPVPQPVEVRVPQPVPVPVAQPVPLPVSVTKHVPVSVPSVNILPSTYGIVPSTYDIAPSTFGVVSSPVGVVSSPVGVVSSPIGVATSGLVSSQLSSGLLSGHEYELGSSHLGSISSTSLDSGAFKTGLDISTFSSGGGYSGTLTPHIVKA